MTEQRLLMSQQRGPQNGKLLVSLQTAEALLGLAAMPAELAADHSPAMALPVSVTLVALTTKLLRISRKHRLNCRSPGLQAQPVEATLELLKPLPYVSSWRRSPGRQDCSAVGRLVCCQIITL
jgi:hypothetical protein